MSPLRLLAAVEHALDHVSHFLPAQGPLEVFIHHNTLHAFEDRYFFEALRDAERMLGFRTLWPLERYLELRRAGRIDDAAVEAGKRAWRERGGTLPELDSALRAAGVEAEALLDAVLSVPLRVYGSEEELQYAIDEHGLLVEPGARALFDECRRLPLARPLRPRSERGVASPRTLFLRAGYPDSALLVNPVMIRLTAAYLDLGLAHRAWPERERGFLAGFQALYLAASRPIPSWQATLREDVEDDVRARRSAIEIVAHALAELGADEDDVEPLVREILFQLPGWAGMMNRFERVPSSRPEGAPPASLAEFLAVRIRHDLAAWRYLAAEAGVDGPLRELAARLERRRGRPPLPLGAHEGAYPLFCIATYLALDLAAVASLDASARERLLAAAARLEEEAPRILHEAYELHYADRVLAALVHPERPAPVLRSGRPTVDVVTCIDDREESFRRAIEDTDPCARTFGAAGFFGLPIAFRGLDEPGYVPLCPIVQTPVVHVVERPEEVYARHGEVRALRRGLVGGVEAMVLRGTRSFCWGTLLTPILGLWSALLFAAQVLFPRATTRARKTVSKSFFPAPPTRLEHDPEGRSVDFLELVARIQATLEGIGLTEGFAEVVVILGHGSSTVNNPHESAYDCGACGGRRGGPNARYFAMLANDPKVRAELRTRGIEIPGDTIFVGGMHNTANDEVELYDLDKVPESKKHTLEQVQQTLEIARRRAAHERCRRFASAPRKLSLEGALRHVEARAVDLAECRTELGHATNAVCVVGRRALTEGLFFDRRAFLVSYDPEIDPEGRILERTLAAVIPVCAGISLEYFFSSLDNLRFGCGTKLPHNVVGLLGVMEGSESDLRTGLPLQMVEIHEPMRLLLVCETSVERMRAVLERSPGTRAMVEREWVRLVTIDPHTRVLHASVLGRLVPYVPGVHPLPRRPDSMACYVVEGQSVDGYLPVFGIERRPCPSVPEVAHA